MAKVVINGLGRIGRATLKILLGTPELELAAMNDLLPADNLAYLLKYDSVYGRYEKEVKAAGDSLAIAGQAGVDAAIAAFGSQKTAAPKRSHARQKRHPDRKRL